MVLEPFALVDNVLGKLFAVEISEDAVDIGDTGSLDLKWPALPVMHVRTVRVQLHEKLFVLEDPFFVYSIDVVLHAPSGEIAQHFFHFFLVKLSSPAEA